MTTVRSTDHGSPEEADHDPEPQSSSSGHFIPESSGSADPDENHIASIADFMTVQLIGDSWLMTKDEIYDYRQDYSRLKDFLDRRSGLDLSAIGKNGMSPLHIAVLHGMVDCAELLLSRGASVETRATTNAGGCLDLTPLEYFQAIALDRWEDPPRSPTTACSIPQSDSRLGRKPRYDYTIQMYMYEVFEINKLVRNNSQEAINIIRLGKDGYYTYGVQYLSDIQNSIELRNTETYSPDQMLLVHVNATNGVVLAKIARALERILQGTRYDLSEYALSSFCRWRSLGTSSVTPGDPLLKAQQPYYKSNRDQEWIFTTIAFPCLALQTVEYHKSLRREVERLSQLFPLGQGPIFDDNNQIHMVRTLDEAYYPGLGARALKLRNEDQVVRREFKELPLILTVPQAWIWRLDNIVVSAFTSDRQPLPDSWLCTPRKEDITTNMPTMQTAEFLANQVTLFDHESCFGDVRVPPVLNIFEGAAVSILSEVDEYMRGQQPSGLDINKEAQFVHRISDLRSELAMIQDVLDQQRHVLTLFLNDSLAAPDDRPSDLTEEGIAPYKAKLLDTLTKIGNARLRTEKIDRDAQRIEQVIQDKLNLKRTAASMEAANASIKEARESKMLSVIVLGFTIITLIFTPISFLTALFALDIDTFSSIKYTPEPPSNPNTGNLMNRDSSTPSPVFSGRKMAGIFVGVEILTIILTLTLTIGIAYFLFRNLDRWITVMGSATEPSAEPATGPERRDGGPGGGAAAKVEEKTSIPERLSHARFRGRRRRNEADIIDEV
ncbi:hypothetical protein F5Y14DRAFT_399275 [Nemania sp. NC0429]|nr:hypothetical protein F5Y14DRAFT_399275 [Nemania sp. NC0429]